MATAVPATAWVPAAGDWLMTIPAGTVVLGAVVPSPSENPAFASALVAAASVRPTTFGTVICCGPDETTSATALPVATCVQRSALADDGTRGDRRARRHRDGAGRETAPVMVVVAAACVRPTTFGVATGGGPDETTSATALPAATDVPAIGVWLITVPDGTLALVAVVTVPTVRPRP